MILFLRKKFDISYKFKNEFSFIFLEKISIFLIFCSKYFVKIYMPNDYYFLKNNNNFYFLFLKKKLNFSIFIQILNFYKNSINLYFFKLRLRGLGYRIKKIGKKLYKFFFGVRHYFYFYVPFDIFMKHLKRNFFMLSFNLSKLNDIFANILKLKKIDLYERNNTFVISNKILFLKKRK
jgi:hypothetical protein